MRTFNSLGEINSLEFFSSIFLLFFTVLIFSILSLGYFYNDISFNLKNSLTILSTFYEYFFKVIIENYITLDFPKDFLNTILKLSILPILFISIYIYIIFYFSKIQKKLSSLQLSQYRLFFKYKNIFIFKLSASEKMDYKKFVNNFENALQLFKKGSLRISRYKSNMIKVQFKEMTPTTEYLLKINILDYLKKEKVFLGFSGGSNKKIQAEYININKLLHFGNFGTSGGGKSNTLNQIIVSLIYNLDNISQLIFIDFKGGIEATPYTKFEEEVQTNKIFTLKDNRLELLKKLRELQNVNKERIQYLIDNNQKQFKEDYIFLMLDEVAEILQYTPIDKEEKFVQSEIISILETLFRTSRSQGFRIFVSTQSFVGNASGLTGGMKNNIKSKLMHLTQSTEAIKSVFPEIEILEEEGINPSIFTTGEFILQNEGSELIHARSLYMPEETETYIELLKQVLKSSCESSKH